MSSFRTLALLLSLAGSIAAPTPAEADQPSLAKKNNGQSVTELIATLYDQVNPNARNALMPPDGFVFDFLGGSTSLSCAPS